MTPTIPHGPRELMKITRWVLAASASYHSGRGLLVYWVVLEVLCNMIRLNANEAMPGLGLASIVCRPKARLWDIKSLELLL